MLLDDYLERQSGQGNKKKTIENYENNKTW